MLYFSVFNFIMCVFFVCTVSVHYQDPQFELGFLFKAKILPGAE